jgi:hypothetical protein
MDLLKSCMNWLPSAHSEDIFANKSKPEFASKALAGKTELKLNIVLTALPSHRQLFPVHFERLTKLFL